MEEQEEAIPGTAAAEDEDVMEKLAEVCPMAVPGTTVEIDDMSDGVALTFMAEEEDVGDIRRRVQHLGRMYEMHRGEGEMMWRRMAVGHGEVVREEMGHGEMGHPGMTGTEMGRVPGMGQMPVMNTTVEQLNNGARIVMKPVDPSELRTLRQHVHWHYERMRRGECWALQK